MLFIKVPILLFVFNTTTEIHIYRCAVVAWSAIMWSRLEAFGRLRVLSGVVAGDKPRMMRYLQFRLLCISSGAWGMEQQCDEALYVK